VTAATVVALLVIAVWTWGVVAWCRRRPWGDAGRRFFRHPRAIKGMVVLVFLATVALCAPLVTPFAPYQQILTLQNHAPTWQHPLGTDFIGRDVWSRLAYGARVSLGVGTLGMVVAVTLGGLVGAAAGYFRGWTDALLMRCVDIGLSIPRIFLVLAAVALWGKLGVADLTVLLGLTGWFATSRIVRAEVMSVRERPYTDAVRALGARPWRIVLRHVLPNSSAALIVSAALGIGNMMLLEAGLSFLGAGIRPPQPSWGNMIADGQDQLGAAPWTTLFPGLAIALAVMALNATGDALRDALDPKAQGV
jgi:peptide/nickel transport system permease protein